MTSVTASTTGSPLAQGIEAMRQGQYKAAIPLLEAGCHQAAPESEAYGAAAKVLVHAYAAVGDIDAALVLCARLAEHPSEAHRHWAWKKRPALEKQRPTEGQVTQFVTLESLEADQTAFQINNSEPTGQSRTERQQLDAGLIALEAKQYGRAVQQLEAYLKQIQFANAKPHTHIALARAYCGNRQRREAIALCEHLRKTGDPGSQRWAAQFTAAMKCHPREPDPLAAERATRERSQVLQWDISQKILVLSLHLSIYGGLMLSPLLPGSLWHDLGQALLHQGSLSPALMMPLAIALLPILFPLGLVYLAPEKALQTQGREVVNYWITMLAILLVTSLGSNLLAQVQALLAQVPLLFNLVRWAIAIAGFSYGISPLLAIGWFWFRPNRVFRYPFILRLL